MILSEIVNNSLLVSDLCGFIELKEQWATLVAGNVFEPFLCNEWHEIWLNHFLSNNKLAILASYVHKDLFGIAPFFVKRENVKGVSINKLELIGNTYSPIRNLMCKNSNDIDKVSIATLLLQSSKKMIANWDVMELSCIPEEGALFEQLKQAVKRLKLPYHEYSNYGDWYQDNISCTGDEFFLQLPNALRKDILYCQRRLEKEGQVSFSVITSPDNLENAMDDYYSTYSKSWQKQERLGPTFHRDLAKMAAGNGWLRLGFLRYNGSPIAAQFWIVCNATAYIMKTVYDQEYKKFSPGKVLTANMMKHVIDIDKVSTIDYVQGDESYKKAWTPKRRERKGIRVYNYTSKGMYLALCDKIVSPVINNNSILRVLKQQLIHNKAVGASIND